MSNELQAQLSTGSTLYAILLNAVGQVWNGSAFETVNGANWATYDIAMTESVAGLYTADMPAVDAGVYSYVVYEQAGASPANTDEWTGNGYLEWDGSAVLPMSTIDTNVDTIDGIVDNILTDTGTTLPNAISAIDTDSVLDVQIDGTITLRKVINRMAGALAGKLSGGGTTTLTFRDLSDTLDRIIATVDASGNRSAITYND